MRLQMTGRARELALFDLAIDSKLRACDLVSLRVRDVRHGDQVASRAIVLQHKTQRIGANQSLEASGVLRQRYYSAGSSISNVVASPLELARIRPL